MYFQLILVFAIYLIESSAQEIVTINILQTNEEDNVIAKQAVAAAVNYANNNTEFGVSINLECYDGKNNVSAKIYLDEICEKYDHMISEMQASDLILDTTKAGHFSETVRLFSKRLSIPTLITSYGQKLRNLNGQAQKYILQMIPPADTIPHVINRIVDHLNLTNAVIFYESDLFYLNSKHKNLLKNTPTRHVFTKLEYKTKHERSKELSNYRNMQDMNNYFLLGSPENISIFLESVDPQFFEKTYAWFAITSYDKDFSANLKNASIMFIRPNCDDENKEQLAMLESKFELKSEPTITSAFYFDIAIRVILSIRDAMLTDNWNISSVACSDFVGDNAPKTDVDLRRSFHEVNQSFTYSPISFKKSLQDTFRGLKGLMKFTMHISAMSILEGKTVETVPLGTWLADMNGELNVTNKKRFEGMKAITVLRVASILQPPFVMVDPSSPSGFKGFCIDLMDLIAKRDNLKYKIEIVADGQYGNINEQGEWNGIVKKLKEKTADVGLGALSVMAERESVVDFTVPFYDLVGIHIMMQVIIPPASMFKFLTVLETDVWLCLLGIYFCASTLLWLFARFSPYSYQNSKEKYKYDDTDRREFNLRECLWFCMTSLTPQGGGDAPKNLSGRLIAATWWLYGFIIIASYTANLAAFLTIPRFDKDLETLEDFSLQYKIRYAPVKGTQAMDYFERMAAIEKRFYKIWEEIALNDSITATERAKLAVWDFPVSDKYTKLWEAMQETGLPNTLEDAVARVKNSTVGSGFAFIGDANDIRYQVMINCDLITVGDEFSKKPYAIAVQQGSPLKDKFDEVILDLLNKRELEKVKEKWWTKANENDCAKHEDPSDGIALKNIGGVFLVILVGLGMGIVTLIFEYFYYRVKEVPKIVDYAIAARRNTFFLANDEDVHSSNSVYSNFPALRMRARSRSLSFNFKL